MELNITARHLELTPPLADYVRKKIDKAQRHSVAMIWGQAILSVEKHRHIAEFVVHTPGSTFRAKGEAGDLYSAIDLAAHKLDLHLSKIKDKMSDHRQKTKNGILKGVSTVPQNGAGEEPEASPLNETSRIALRSFSVKEAIRELNTNGIPVFVFINRQTSQISAIYKNKKGYGLLEAEEEA
jgi:putative sigma-54 modulation protein